MIKNDKITARLRMRCCHGNGLNPENKILIKEPSYMGNLSGEFCEQNRKDKVTRVSSATYARYPGLLVNTLGSHLKTFSSFPMRSISRPNSMLSLASNLDRSCDMTKGASDVLVTAQPFCSMLLTKLLILAP